MIALRALRLAPIVFILWCVVATVLAAVLAELRGDTWGPGLSDTFPACGSGLAHLGWQVSDQIANLERYELCVQMWVRSRSF